MKLAIITDIHNASWQLGGTSILPIVADFVSRANAAGADLLIDLGDRIDDFDRDTDLASATELAEIFHRFEGRRVHLQGNHDVVNLTADDQERLLGRRRGNVAIDLGEMRLLVWEPDVRLKRGPQVAAAPAKGELTGTVQVALRMSQAQQRSQSRLLNHLRLAFWGRNRISLTSSTKVN